MDLLTGFTTLLVAIGCGAVLAHVGVLDVRSQRTLGEIAFFVASPALMVVTVSDIDPGGAALNLVVSATCLVAAFVGYVLIARLRYGARGGDLIIGGLASSYVNAGNLGLGLAAYVVGDITVVVPTLLVQLLVVQPVALIALDRETGGGRGPVAMLKRLGTNPLTLGALIGLVLALTSARIPTIIRDPLELLGGAAIPLMLISYGAALRLSPRPGRAGHNPEVVTASLLKLVLQPVLAFAVGTALGLTGTALLGVVLTASLPTAQNIFLHATRYRVGEDIARETILLTTVFSLPIALLVALLLG